MGKIRSKPNNKDITLENNALVKNGGQKSIFSRLQYEFQDKLFFYVVSGLLSIIFSLGLMQAYSWKESVDKRIDKAICQLYEMTIDQEIENFTEKILQETAGVLESANPVFKYSSRTINSRILKNEKCPDINNKITKFANLVNGIILYTDKKYKESEEILSKIKDRSILLLYYRGVVNNRRYLIVANGSNPNMGEVNRLKGLSVRLQSEAYQLAKFSYYGINRSYIIKKLECNSINIKIKPKKYLNCLTELYNISVNPYIFYNKAAAHARLEEFPKALMEFNKFVLAKPKLCPNEALSDDDLILLKNDKRIWDEFNSMVKELSCL